MLTTIEQVEQRTYTVEEYFEIAEKSEERLDYVRGRIIPMVGSRPEHSLISMNIGAALHGLLPKNGRFFIYGPDLKIKTNLGSYRHADVSVFVTSSGDDPSNNTESTNPLVIFEVLSPSTEALDRGDKFNEYRSIESLQAYVLVSQDKRLIECLTPQNDGSWRHTFSDADSIEIPPLNCTLKLNDVYLQVTFKTSST